MKIHIANGHLVDPKNGIDRKADLYIAAGKVVGVGTAPKDFHANRTVDAAGLVVAPGLVDLAVRLREPGYEYMATLETELDAACAGGVTSVVCQPDTDPVLDEPGLVNMLRFRAKNLTRARVYPLGALTLKLEGVRITEMAELSDAGCVAFTQADTPVVDTQVLLRALQYAATFGYRVWLQPQDAFLAKGGVAHEGEMSTRLGLPGIPAAAETVALATLLQLARATGVRLHVTRLSTAEGVAMLRRAKAEGLAVTCDVAIHHLHLCDIDLGFFDAHANLAPPLRSQSDRDALRAGLADGTIDALCSDHTPVDDDAKQVPFGEAEPGATGLELLLPLALKWGAEMKLPLATTLARITADAARVLGRNVGHLAIGSSADVCLFDPAASTRVTRDTLRSQGKNTPFLGLELPGRVRHVLVEGHTVYENGRAG